MGREWKEKSVLNRHTSNMRPCSRKWKKDSGAGNPKQWVSNLESLAFKSQCVLSLI